MIGAFNGDTQAANSGEPSPIDTTGLEPLGEEWLEINPYQGNARAIEIGESGYTQNCARCHGISAISGGLAPDLRYLPPDEEGDEWYVMRAKKGAVRDGRVYMPPFGESLGQEALWAIRSWLVTQYTDD
ncbi:MAG: cytochrome c-550 PedF [Alphaproteobacteria bacterium]|nr:cytochrome c-550 PedF [Alphaproteobacteria bacterium]